MKNPAFHAIVPASVLLLTSIGVFAHADVLTSGDISPSNPIEWTSSTEAYIGESSLGILDLDGGTSIVSQEAYIGHGEGGTGLVAIWGSGSTWTIGYNSSSYPYWRGDLWLGTHGEGALEIRYGGGVRSGTGYIRGGVLVEGNGSKWVNGGVLLSGDDEAPGSLGVFSGGEVNAVDGSISIYSNGAATVDGVGSTLTATGGLSYGIHVYGTLDIIDGGTVSGGYSSISGESGGGIVTVSGSDSMWVSNGYLIVGRERIGGGEENEHGTLEISDEGTVRVQQFLILGYETGTSGDLTISGEGSSLTIVDSGATVAKSGSGTLVIEDGGSLTSAKGRVAQITGSVGEVAISGGSWNVDTVMTLGGQWGEIADGGTATVVLSNGGEMTVGETLEWHGTASMTIDASSFVTIGNADPVLGAVTIGDDGVLKAQGQFTPDVNIMPGGILALLGDADESLAGFLDLIDELDVVHYWDESTSDWLDLTAAIAGEDYTLSYSTNGDLAGYTVLKCAAGILGDTDADGVVGSTDLDRLRSLWNQPVSTGTPGDINGDGIINSRDLDLVRANWGAGLATVPEPGALLLALGGAVLLVWRRRN